MVCICFCIDGGGGWWWWWRCVMVVVEVCDGVYLFLY